MLVTLNWLKEFVNIRLKPAALADRLTMSGLEVEALGKAGDDCILDINVTPNRGDCLGVMGVAREVAAITGARFIIPPRPLGVRPPPAKADEASGLFDAATKGPDPKKGGRGGLKGAGGKVRDFISIKVKNTTRCPRYTARVIDGVKIGPSPKWLAGRLEACGIRSINNVVDATNYMMLETGQPFHAFDWRDLRGYKIIVQTPKEEIDFVTLDGVRRRLTHEDLLICDADGPIAIGGVMGGLNSEVKPDTTTIVLESAYFDPVSVRRTSKRLGAISESSRRFERVVDERATAVNLNRLAELIVETAGGTPTEDYIDIYPHPIKPKKVKLVIDDVNRLLGMDLEPQAIRDHLRSLGITISKNNLRASAKSNLCYIPTWRTDLTRPVDLIEEVARLEGYDRIGAAMPAITMSAITRPPDDPISARAKGFLAARGFFEAVNLGFNSPDELARFTTTGVVKISNPLGAETSLLKTTLLPGLLNNVRLNISLGRDSVRLFELRSVFLKKKGKIAEPKRLSGIMYGMRQGLCWTARQEATDFHDAKGIVEALAGDIGIHNIKFEAVDKYDFLQPQAGALVTLAGEEIGVCGLLHPSILENAGVFELDWDAWCRASLGRRPALCALDRFPCVRRDVALLINEDITSDEITSVITEFNNPLIKEAFPFDVYKGKGITPGKKSAAYAVFYTDPERTLTNEEVNDTHARLVSYLKEKLGAEIR